MCVIKSNVLVYYTRVDDSKVTGNEISSKYLSMTM